MKKALFKIKNTIIGLGNPCSLLEKLFDNLVTPVMLYCSEICGTGLYRFLIFAPLLTLTCAEKDTTPYEYLHLKFIKEILGVHSKTSNDACRAELNRLPLRGKILNLAFNYWQHLWSSSNSLVSKIVDLTRSHNSRFIQIGSIFNTLCFSYLSYTPILTFSTNYPLSNVSMIYSCKSKI